MYAIVGKTYKLNRRTPHENHKRSDRKMTVDTTPRVIIAGAGPVGTSHLYELDSQEGLFVALKLARAQIPSLVLERVYPHGGLTN